MGTSSSTLAEGVNFSHYFKILMIGGLLCCHDFWVLVILLIAACAIGEIITNDVCLNLSFYWLRECGLWSQHENILTFFKFPCNASVGHSSILVCDNLFCHIYHLIYIWLVSLSEYLMNLVLLRECGDVDSFKQLALVHLISCGSDM